jgi:4-aminobutyrate aminotransferase/(S)-3-amino-2-methylpropionate transaminase
MGPPRRFDCGLVYETARGINVVDADGNRYVDLVAGFGAMLLGHSHPRIVKTIQEQSERLLMALGDLYPSTMRLKFEQSLLQFLGLDGWKILLGQSGSDAITAALKTAALATGRPGVIAFTGAYHGLGHAPLALCGLREGYRKPFAEQLNAWVEFLPYPASDSLADAGLTQLEACLKTGRIGAVVIEPILGRGGCVVPPQGFLAELARRTREAQALFIADEIWTGLGRAGSKTYCQSIGVIPDVICLGKGLGGGVPISACLGSDAVMKHWHRQPDVVHTATFSGAALAAATALTTLEVLNEEQLPERALHAGEQWMQSIREACVGLSVVATVRGRGFMIGVDFAGIAGMASTVMFKMLERGYLVSTGGGERDVLVLTPPLNVDDIHREPFVRALREVLEQLS